MTASAWSAAVVLLLPACATMAQDEKWRERAVRYVDALESVLVSPPTEGWDAVEVQMRAKEALLAAPLPSRDDLRTLLVSGRERDRAVAVAVMAVTNRADPSLVAFALDGVAQRSLAVRLLTAQAVAAVAPADLPRMSEAVVRTYSREPASVVIAAALPAIEQLPSREILPLSVALARRDSRELRGFGWVLALRHLPGGLASLRSALEGEGATDAVRALDAEMARGGTSP